MFDVRFAQVGDSLAFALRSRVLSKARQDSDWRPLRCWF